ncbi:MAG: 50S ribosomal protein L29 [Candidatus Kaiserbacteria bacterium]|nr:50S ribosomal protein L29 [Candidatus Kaiserbacteria bacterium]
MTKKDTMTTKTDTELAKTLADTRAALRTERFAAAGARSKDSNSPRKFRAEIARILTEQHARALRSSGEVGRVLKAVA